MRKVPVVAAALLMVTVKAAVDPAPDVDDLLISDLGLLEESVAPSPLPASVCHEERAVCERVRAGDWKCWDPDCHAVCTQPRVESTCLTTSTSESIRVVEVSTEYEVRRTTSRAECVTLTYPSCCTRYAANTVDRMHPANVRADNDQSCVTYKVMKDMTGWMTDTNNHEYYIIKLHGKPQMVEVGDCSNSAGRRSRVGCSGSCRQEETRMSLLARSRNNKVGFRMFNVNAYCSCKAN